MAADDVLDTAVFIRLMRHIQLARPIGDAVRHARDPRDVLLIVGARAGDQRGRAGRSPARSHRSGRRSPARLPACGSARRSTDPRSRTSPRASATAPSATSAAISARVRSRPSSSRNRRSNTTRQRSATHGLGTSSTGWPPSMPLMLMVAWREPSGTTGIAVTRWQSAGPSSSRTRSSRCDMPSIALTPRYGMLPCAMRPSATTSNQYTPRWPTQTRSTPNGSGMITALVRSRDSQPVLRQPGDAGKAAALFVHRAADLDRRRVRDAGAPDRLDRKHRRGNAGLHVAGAAAVQLAVEDFAAKRIARPAAAGRHHVEVAVEMDGRPLAVPWRPTTLMRGMLRGVLLAADRRQQLDVCAMRAQLVADHARAGFVFVPGRIDGRNADQPRREIDDLVARTVHFRQHTVESAATITR